MTTESVNITIDDQIFNVEPSIYSGKEIRGLLSISNNAKLIFDKIGDVDIPIDDADLLAIKGGEVFILDSSDRPNNPNSIHCKDIFINGEKVKEVENSKLKISQLKELLYDDISNKALYLELPLEPDYLLQDEYSIVIDSSFRYLLVTKSTTDSDVPDLEDCACKGEKPPKHEKYKIKIDKEKYKVHSPRLTGREILKLAGYDESRYLYQKFAGGERRQIELDEKVDFTEPGIERFHTMRCEHQEGLQEPRQQFQLSKDDSEFLDSLSLKWECVVEGNIKRVVIYGFKLPSGFNVTEVDVNMQISNSYPSSQIDMAYFYPVISRTDGKGIRALCNDNFDGKIWQRWSRHRTPQNPWEPGVDCIATHVAYIESWFTQELDK